MNFYTWNFAVPSYRIYVIFTAYLFVGTAHVSVNFDIFCLSFCCVSMIIGFSSPIGFFSLSGWNFVAAVFVLLVCFCLYEFFNKKYLTSNVALYAFNFLVLTFQIITLTTFDLLLPENHFASLAVVLLFNLFCRCLSLLGFFILSVYSSWRALGTKAFIVVSACWAYFFLCIFICYWIITFDCVSVSLFVTELLRSVM